MRNPFSLEGQVALVTGGGAGIGLACVERFSREGARVAVLDRDPEGGGRAVERATRAGGEAAFFQGDAASRVEVEIAFRQALEA